MIKVHDRTGMMEAEQIGEHSEAETTTSSNSPHFFIMSHYSIEERTSVLALVALSIPNPALLTMDVAAEVGSDWPRMMLAQLGSMLELEEDQVSVQITPHPNP